MKRKTLVILLFLLLPTVSCTSRQDFFVSPGGSDSNPGTRDKPFATVEKARQAVLRALENGQNSNLTVWLSGGTYFLGAPLQFTSADSGRNGFTVTYRAMPGEFPVISGGVRLRNWSRGVEGTWSAELPEPFGITGPRELFIEGARATRARTPDKGFLRIKNPTEDKRTGFYFEKGDFPLPGDSESVELVLLHDWSSSRIKVKEIDEDENRLTAVDSIGARALDFFELDHWEAHPRYFLENSMAFLDQAHEWIYNDSDRRIYLKLPESQSPEEMSIIVPLSDSLVSLQGTPENPVSEIIFSGLTFAHCAWSIPSMGYSGIQACHFDPRPDGVEWPVVPAAVGAEWADGCSFDGCTFTHLGGSGLWIGTGSSNCTVTSSVFTDISGNGIMIGEGRDRMVNGKRWWKSAPSQAATGNRIEDCRITECGEQFFGAVGIWCGLAARTLIRNNEIADLPYTGISVGWMWNPEPTPCRENIVEGNHIHDIMQTLSDGGGIYMLGLQPGSRLINNKIHDVSINAGRAESNGMFIDEGSTDLVISGNLIYNIARSPLRFHKATLNLVEENVLFCTGDNPPVRYNSTSEEDILMKGNHISRDSEDCFQDKLEQAIDSWDQAGG